MMLYPDNFEEKVGFDVIRQMLSAECLCSLGVERVGQMCFSSRHDVVTRDVGLVMEFCSVLEGSDFPDENFFDLRAALKRIRIENAFLDVKELFDLQRSLDTIDRIVAFLRREENVERWRGLSALTEGVVTFPEVVRRIGEILDKFGEVKDSASPGLLRIRRELASTAGGISRLLNGILRAAKAEGVVDRDLSPTVRDGRLVIPVAPGMKRRIRGIVHDESDSGRTVFVEPAEVVEANNRVRELEAEERREVVRILQEFTSSLRPLLPDVVRGYGLLAEIDFIRAKARFALRTGSVMPRIEDGQVVDWSLAVHPLLRISLERHGRKVVPLDIVLTPKQRILLISGPNAGGKSVCLKTVGLLQYMLQCGMPIPVAASSRAGIFQNLFIDIGDEQSLEDDLSTYSSHLLNMKQMLRFSNGASLVLIDEFGGGTEPLIGGAIAEAVLKRFNQKKAFGVITTHYQNLKLFAQDTEGVVNGAMLYDRGLMRPLFQLRIGNPGSSFAVEIARKIGLPEDVIADASEIVGKDYISADKYLQDIVRDKRYWENKRQSIHLHEKQMEETIGRYEEEIGRLHEERKAIISAAKAEAQELLRSSNARIEQTIKEIKEAQAEREKTRDVRQGLADFKQIVDEIDVEAIDEKIRRQMEKLKARRRRREERKANGKDGGENVAVKGVSAAVEREKACALKVGDFVKIKGQASVGQILKLGGSEALVAFGSITVNVKLGRLELSSAPKAESRAFTFVGKATQDDMRERSLNFRQDLDVRGMRGDEAVQAVTYFIDDALVASVSRVRILHGTGNGILRTLIRQYLATVPAVADFRDENVQFGGAGITVVDLV